LDILFSIFISSLYLGDILFSVFSSAYSLHNSSAATGSNIVTAPHLSQTTDLND